MTEPRGPRTTVQAAVRHGMLTVTAPVMAMLCGPAVLILLATTAGLPKDYLGAVMIVAGLLALGAWPLWSVLTPRWRVWAYGRVDDLEELKARAVAAGLIWPDGHLFEKTEYRPAAVREALARLERRNRA